MNQSPSRFGPTCQLTLADGRIWDIAPAEGPASVLVRRLSEVFGLPSQTCRDPLPSAHLSAEREDPEHAAARRHVLLDQQASAGKLTPAALRANPVILHCPPREALPGMELFSALQQLTAVVGCDAQERGGLLLHGALAEWQGHGVLLAAPGGTGKTTASRRLPPPWRSLCDDATLVLPVGRDGFWAHPWPTLSRFVLDGGGGSWDVQWAVPLKRICFLLQAPHEQVEPVGAGQATTLLLQAVRQASWGLTQASDRAEQRRLNLQVLENVCALARTVPTCFLHLSLTGAFWEELQRLLAG